MADRFAPYLEHLTNLSFVRDARVVELEGGRGDGGVDARITMETPEGQQLLSVEIKRSHLSRDLAEHLVQRGRSVKNLIVFAPHVGTGLARRFAEAHVNFIDLAGNCHLEIADRYFVHIEGRHKEKTLPTNRALRASSYRVLFVLLTNDELLGASARAVAEAAGGVSPQTVQDTRRLLVDSRILVPRSHGWGPRGWDAALELFIGGFAAALAPRLMIGRFRAREHLPEEIEQALKHRLGDHIFHSWRWGGGAACQRLTGFYRGNSTVIYLAASVAPKQLQLIPDPNGDVILSLSPCPLAFRSPHEETVHPLLAYADLLAERNSRATEGAAQIYDRFLRTKRSASP